ncbi:P-loop containing nucleoside triphosphate hydrolase protein, partial [Rozella allomycis CSF55]
VNNLSLDVKNNELLALLGPNGCGKTTTLNMLTSQMTPTSGSVHLKELDVHANRLNAIRQMGVCPQFDNLLVPSMTVQNHLKIFLLLNGQSSKVADEYIKDLLQAMGLSSFANYKCGSLSGGTKRKVSTLIAIMLNRDLVVLDESSTGLDPLARHKMWCTVRELNKNRTTIMTTHYLNETSSCDRIAVVNQGKLSAIGTEHEL